MFAGPSRAGSFMHLREPIQPVAMIEPVPAYELDQRLSGQALSHYEPSTRSRPLDRHRRTHARAPDAGPRVPKNPPGLAFPPRRGPLSPRKIIAQPVRQNIADPCSVDNSR